MLQYQILQAVDQPNGQVHWVLNGNNLGPNLPAILNNLGMQNWEVVATGDFIGSVRTEIILMKRN